jgi:carboxyl-terminal processing protease
MKSVLISVFICVHPWLLSAADPADQLAPELKKMVDVFVIMEEESADPIQSDAAFYQGAIPSMLRTLDPHSSFFDRGQFQQLNEMQHSERKGFGTVVSLLPGRVIVLQAMQGSPAAKAGLSGGDEIVAINRIPLGFLDVEQLTELLTEAREQSVTLEVRRPGQQATALIAMSPALLDQPTVDRAFMLDQGIGYLRITSFEQPTGALVRQAIEQLGAEYLKGLIVDLRGNPGGVVQSAVETAALFLSPDQLIFSVKGRNAEAEEVYVPKLSTPYTFPMAVLVNGNTASASEIVSGALQDHDRAVILGEPSYGKGLVQQVFPLSNATGMALTTAFYYTPSGRSIQKPLSGGQLDAATIVAQGPFRSDAGRLLRGGGGIQPDQVVYPALQARFQQVIDASGSLTTFAGEYLQTHDVADSFEVTPNMLDELKLFLSERRIQPDISEWLTYRAWITSRLKQEIVNLKFGVAKGDEIELQRDPVIQAALKKLHGEP